MAADVLMMFMLPCKCSGTVDVMVGSGVGVVFVAAALCRCDGTAVKPEAGAVVSCPKSVVTDFVRLCTRLRSIPANPIINEMWFEILHSVRNVF